MKLYNDKRPYLRVNIENVETLALIDSGSSASILGSKGLHILKLLKAPIHYDHFLHVTTADGKPQDFVGYVRIPLTVNKVCKEIKLLIIPSVTQ